MESSRSGNYCDYHSAVTNDVSPGLGLQWSLQSESLGFRMFEQWTEYEYERSLE